MSAYCNNSPANYTDLLGYLPYHNDIIGNRPMMYGSNDSRYETVTIHVTDFSSDPTINAICKNIANEISAFFDAFIELIELGNDLLEVDSFNDLVDVVADIKENQISEDVIGLNRVRAGWNNMREGFAIIIMSPDITWGDEIAGASRFAYGFGQLVMGIGELFDWR